MPRKEHRLAKSPLARKQRRLLGFNVRQARMGRDWSPAELAGKVGISVPMIYNIEKGENMPSASVLFALMELFRPGVQVPLMEETE